MMYNFTTAFLPLIKKERDIGSILFIGSGSGILPMGENKNAGYTIGKAGIHYMSRLLAMEFEKINHKINVNDKKNVEVKFPENYQKADLSGKPASFEVTIKDILEAEKSKINDELATRMGLPDLKSLKEAIKNQIDMNYKATARNRIKRD